MRGARRRTLHLLLAAAFAAAGAAGSPGIHDCPHHEPPDPGSFPTSTEGAVAASVSAAPTSPSGDLPCRCLGDCHGSAVTPLPPAFPGALSAAGAVSAPSPRGAPWILRGPRHLLFELHLPNAPPHPV